MKLKPFFKKNFMRPSAVPSSALLVYYQCKGKWEIISKKFHHRRAEHVAMLGVDRMISP
jgi:hypothetical protein